MNTPATATTASDKRHRQREDMAVLDAHQLRDRRIVGGRPKGAAELGAIEQKLQPADDRHGDDELNHRQHADCEVGRELPARHLDRPGIKPAAVMGEQDEQHVLDDDRQAEGHQQRRQLVAEREVQQTALQRIAEDAPTAGTTTISDVNGPTPNACMVK